MRIVEFIKGHPIAMSLIAVVVAFVLFVLPTVKVSTVEEGGEAKPMQRSFTKNIAEGVSIRRHGLYGIDLVRCGSCRLEKRKLGPLTIGAFNVLVLDDLHVVLPETQEPADSSSSESGSSLTEMSGDLLSHFGLGQDFLRSQGLPLRVSGLVINNLSVGKLEGTNVVHLFSAKKGEAKRDGLHLTELEVDGQIVGKGLLDKKRNFKLIYGKDNR